MWVLSIFKTKQINHLQVLLQTPQELLASTRFMGEFANMQVVMKFKLQLAWAAAEETKLLDIEVPSRGCR
jgi:hypothetical protein